ncbi:Zn-dependent hydrolase [Pedobacter ginsenosidimutans]|uniref:Zn-dependent hydrolase n=1 Tax=Pedobacter ginsenosidimutans TaxID=687842 RepID=A0A0T5VVH9_9SPHI|nr:MBL fold metallo-hydrolase [Pedobacter ginsenosidimutans]KRT17868.1 Zn-dependent hydrolase [Pedobacter ginsenosidimutans]
MIFQNIFDKSLAQASYFIGCQAKGEAIVIDAQRDIDIYIDIASKNNLRITHITETHIHADFLCGSRELSARTGAQIYLSEEGSKGWLYEFAHIGLKHSDKIHVGNLSLEVIHTPGHTPESISFLLTDHPATDKPVMIFTGDSVFVGDVGRPDLLEKSVGLAGTQVEGAKDMYRSIQNFAKLPEYLQIWPGHGAGSSCGKSLGAVPSSTIGYEKIRNWAFQFENDEQGFVDYLLEGQPEPPKYFAMMKHLNKVARPLLTEVPKHPKLSKLDFLHAYHNGIRIVDTRDKVIFEQGFIPGSINIQGNKSFATWCGWILTFQEQFILIASEHEIEDLTRKLMRIGLDNMYGYFSGVEDLDFKLETADVIDIETFKQLIKNEDTQIIDVRNASEYQAGHIKGAENIFIGTMKNNLDKISKAKHVLIHCQSGDRAAIAYSILKDEGFEKLKNFSGGINEWIKNNELVK